MRAANCNETSTGWKNEELSEEGRGVLDRKGYRLVYWIVLLRR